MEKQLKLQTPSLQLIGTSNTAVLEPQGAFLKSNTKDLSSSRYVGVSQRRNGRWAAQVYCQKQNLWLGSFKEEAEAARAYDVGALYLRGNDAITNFKQLPDETELAFLRILSVSEMVDMLRKHSYEEELAQHVKSRQINGISGLITQGSWEHLFDKILTPCDLKWKLLGVPKKYAQKLFPLKMSSDSSRKQMLIKVEDDSGRSWRFQLYCRKRREYFLNKGWNCFANEKNLKIGDLVSFYRSIGLGAHMKLFIRKQSQNLVDQLIGTKLPSQPGEKVFRLFGVNIRVKVLNP